MSHIIKRSVAILIFNICNRAGTERAVTNLANILSEEKHNVTIISCFSSPNDKNAFTLNSNVNIIHLGMKPGGFILRFWDYFTVLRKLRQISYNFDFLLGTTHALNTLLFFLPKRMKKIACEHFAYDACPLYSRIIRRVIYPFLDAVVLLTKTDAAKYTFMDKKKIFVIPNSLSFIQASTADLSKKRMIAIGRLTYLKGFDILLDIAVLLKRELPDWHIDVFGEGEDHEALLNKAERLCVNDYVSFLPPTNDVKKELLNSSIYLMSSRFEGLPMVLLEAQACGLPIVSFDCPEGPRNVISDKKNGFLIKCFDVESFSLNVGKLAKNNDQRIKMGTCAKYSSNRYSPSSISYKWDQLFAVVDIEL